MDVAGKHCGVTGGGGGIGMVITEALAKVGAGVTLPDPLVEFNYPANPIHRVVREIIRDGDC